MVEAKSSDELFIGLSEVSLLENFRARGMWE